MECSIVISDYKWCLHSFSNCSVQPISKKIKLKEKKWRITLCRMSSKNNYSKRSRADKKEGVMAIDIGTSGTKAAIFSSTGRLLTSSFASHVPPAPSPLWHGSMEQDQEDWWLATKGAIRGCLTNMSSDKLGHNLPIAIALTGQMQDVILLPKKTKQRRNAILYSDARASVEAVEIANLAGGQHSLISITGHQQGGTSLLAKLRWLDKYDTAAATESTNVLFGGHDYIAWKLTGAVVTDATTASTTGLTDCSFKYAESLLMEVNLGHWLHILPPIMPVDIPIGAVTKAAAEELGFPPLEGIPVLHCSGDAGTCSFGAGAGSPGSMYGYLGTTGWVAGSFLQTEQCTMGTATGIFTLAHPIPNLVFRTGSIMTAGGNLAWAASNLVFKTRTSIPLKEVDDAASMAKVGCGGLLYLPFLSGERCPFEDPTARAAFIGISQMTTQKELFRAIMEGVAFAMRSARDALVDELNPVVPIRLVGGGARSNLWPQIIANVFGQTVEVLEESQDVAVRGAALLAGNWLGWQNTNGNWLKVLRSYKTCDEEIEKYRCIFSIYKEAYHCLKPIFKKSNETL